MRFGVPAQVAQRVQAWQGGTPAPTRDAATVVLMRDGPAGIEVYLLVRTGAMAAFAGMTVFPGGGVDPDDLAADALPWYGPSAVDWPLAAPPALARALVCAAVRETFEESGVLLAGPAPGGPAAGFVGDTTSAEWERVRQALEARALSLSRLLTARSLVLRADLLRPWAHWITPVQEARRYDTRFFVAALPAGQEARHTAGEAERAAWMRPADALAARDRGELTMVPPTALTLADLAEHAAVDDVLAAAPRREIRPVTPRLVADGSGSVRFLVPGDPDYDGPSE